MLPQFEHLLIPRSPLLLLVLMLLFLLVFKYWFHLGDAKFLKILNYLRNLLIQENGNVTLNWSFNHSSYCLKSPWSPIKMVCLELNETLATLREQAPSLVFQNIPRILPLALAQASPSLLQEL